MKQVLVKGGKVHLETVPPPAIGPGMALVRVHYSLIDLCLPVARSGFHGLYIEMKHGKNKPTKEQIKWIEALIKQGYAVYVCYSWDSAKDVLEKYLKNGG